MDRALAMNTVNQLNIDVTKYLNGVVRDAVRMQEADLALNKWLAKTRNAHLITDGYEWFVYRDGVRLFRHVSHVTCLEWALNLDQEASDVQEKA